jgi:hypothetical protein
MNTVKLNQTPPSGISPKAMTGAFNNRVAEAYANADPRFLVKARDRAGLSRGAGQWALAGSDSAKALADGLANAYGQNLQNSSYNANAQLAGQQAQETQAQALGALQQQNAYANEMAGLQRQQMVMGLLGGLFKGFFD